MRLPFRRATLRACAIAALVSIGSTRPARALQRFRAPLLAQLAGGRPSPDGPCGVTLADLNGDGVLDIVAPGPAPSGAMVLIGQGDDTFSSPRSEERRVGKECRSRGSTCH